MFVSYATTNQEVSGSKPRSDQESVIDFFLQVQSMKVGRGSSRCLEGHVKPSAPVVMNIYGNIYWKVSAFKLTNKSSTFQGCGELMQVSTWKNDIHHHLLCYHLIAHFQDLY